MRGEVKAERVERSNSSGRHAREQMRAKVKEKDPDLVEPASGPMDIGRAAWFSDLPIHGIRCHAGQNTITIWETDSLRKQE